MESKHVRWLLIAVILILNNIIYKFNKIKYSNTIAINLLEVTHNKVQYYLAIIILINTILFTIFLNTINKIPFNNSVHFIYQLVCITFFNIILINISTPKPIIDSVSFKPPIKKMNTQLLIIAVGIITTILFIDLIKENPKNPLKYFILVNIIIYIYLFYSNKNFSTCKYNLPSTYY